MFLFRLSQDSGSLSPSLDRTRFYRNVRTIDPDFEEGNVFENVIIFSLWLQPQANVPSHPCYLRATHLFYLFLLDKQLVTSS
jgi:hypothetical protein